MAPYILGVAVAFHLSGFFLYLHFLAIIIVAHSEGCLDQSTCGLMNTTQTQAYTQAFFWPIYTFLWEYRRYQMQKEQ